MSKRKRFTNKFNILLAGGANVGKTTFFSTFRQALTIRDEFDIDAFTAPLISESDLNSRMSVLSVSPHFVNQLNTPKNIVSHRSFSLVEHGEEVTLSLFDTLGLSAAQENIDSFQSADIAQPPVDKNNQPITTLGHILQFIRKQFDIALIEESKVKRDIRNPHSQIHVCLYFLDPFHMGLTPLDVYAMKRLSQVINVIPVLTKADSLTTTLATKVKKSILRDIQQYRIPIFDFPDEDETDQELMQQNATLRRMQPFTVIGAEDMDLQQPSSKITKASSAPPSPSALPSLTREFPWGTVNIENPAHCDFTLLRQVLLSTHRESLKRIVEEYYYERYRTLRLTQIVGRADDNGDRILRESLKPVGARSMRQHSVA